ncbi:MAG: EamA family transporter [Bacteroidota bacterium]
MKVVLGLVVVSLIWGTTWVAIKIGLRSIPPILGASLRFLLASLFLLGLIEFRKIQFARDQTFWNLGILMGLSSFGIPLALVYWGTQYIPTGLASILFATHPFAVALCSYFLLKNERLTKPKLAGIILGFIGIYIIFASEFSFRSNLAVEGMAAIILSSALQAFTLVTVKKYGGPYNTMSLNYVGMVIGGVLLAVMSYFVENHSGIVFNNEAILSLVYLALFGSVITFVTYFWLLKHVEVVLLSLTAFVTPVIAVIAGAVVFSESLTIQMLVGSALVLFGIIVANSNDLLSVIKRGKSFMFDA